MKPSFAEGHLDPALRAALKNKLRPLNVHASSLPFEMGGTGHSWQAQAVINEEIGKVTNALGWIVWAPAIVLRHANTDQIERFVKPFATGQKDVCYAVTEAGAGSDASLMATTAVEEDGVWTLNGEKWHVTSGDVSDYMVLQAATEPEIGDGNTLFFVAMDAPGIEIIDKPKYTHNIIDGHLRLRLVDVKVEDTNRFGPVGGGLSLSKEWFLHERVMIAARCAGAARRLVDEAAQFAQERVSVWSTHLRISDDPADVGRLRHRVVGRALDDLCCGAGRGSGRIYRGLEAGACESIDGKALCLRDGRSRS